MSLPGIVGVKHSFIKSIHSTGIPPFEGDPEEDCPSTKPFADWVVALYALSGTAFAVILLATMYVLVRRRNVTEKQLTIETWKQ